MSPPSLEQLAIAAREGDRAALSALIRQTQDRIYGLSVRMLGDLDDAKDATQDIILRMVTHLATYRGEAAFGTWVHQVATNHLLNVKAGRKEGVSFERFAEQLEQGLAFTSSHPVKTPYDAAVVEEGKLRCTLAMLNCLDRDLRLAYILGEVLELAGDEAAAILRCEAATFRKRLSRARTLVEDFAQGHCGLVNPANRCRCAKQVHAGVELGLIDPRRLLFQTHPVVGGPVARAVIDLAEIKSAAQLMRGHPHYQAPDEFIDKMRQLLDHKSSGPLGKA